MTDKRPRIERLATMVSDIRHEATGSPLAVPETTAWRVTDFGNLISDIYMWFYEEWGSEVSYLARNAPPVEGGAAQVRQFNSTLRDLRTSRQHSGTSGADRSADRWLRDSTGTAKPVDPGDWRKACSALLDECERALESLVALAKSINADAAARGRWQATVSAEAATTEADMVATVLGDLGVSLNPDTQGYLVRRAKADWRYRRQSLTSNDDVGQAIEHVIERLLVGHLIEALPSGYNEVVEAVGLEPGDRRVVGVLLLAHGAAALLDYDSEAEFIGLIEERFAGWFTGSPRD